MTTEEVLEEYGDVPLFFSHYYNFIFVYKSARLDNGDQIFLHLGGNMEKVSAMVVDVEDPVTLDDKAEDDYAYIKNVEKQVIWKDGEQDQDRG
jgi:hypothetical protein